MSVSNGADRSNLNGLYLDRTLHPRYEGKMEERLPTLTYLEVVQHQTQRDPLRFLLIFLALTFVAGYVILANWMSKL